MNINISKVKEIVIRDENGVVVERFQFSQVSLVTNSSKEKTLIITKAGKK